jgi:hypothetical protein
MDRLVPIVYLVIQEPFYNQNNVNHLVLMDIMEDLQIILANK